LTALFVVVHFAIGKGHLGSVATQAALVAVIAGVAVWALMTLASRRLPSAKSLTLVVVLAVAIATLAPAGLTRYAYGDQGSLQLEVSVVDGSIAWGADRNDTFEVGITLSNIGSTVVRVVPFEFWQYGMTDPNGTVLPWAGPVAGRTPFSDPATEEIAPGARLNRGLQATFNWPAGRVDPRGGIGTRRPRATTHSPFRISLPGLGSG
jgi:hypothetical protein